VTQLSGTSYVILGMLGWRPMSGYEIKSIVDKSTRLFWAASYGQIYPELRRLEEEGLIEGRPDPTGGRQRNVYAIAEAGRRELRSWLAAEPEIFEMRDEGLLKLFFGAGGNEESAVGTLEAMRRRSLAKLAELRTIEEQVGPGGYAGMVLSYGIEMCEWQADWCERTIAELESGRVGTGRAA
jgi:DNA-binding PadR family transcriptional regulator